MTIPRALALESGDDGLRLLQRPVRELEKLSTPVIELIDASFAEAQHHLSGLQLVSFELIVELEPGLVGEVDIAVRTSDVEQTVIGYRVDREEVFIDRTLSGNIDFHRDFAGIDSVKIDLDRELLRLQLFVDCYSVEVFVNDGEAILTNLIFPRPQSLGLRLTRASNELRLRRLAIYKLG